MKKFYLIILCFLSYACHAQQKPDTAIAVISYRFTHMRDTTNPGKLYSENMRLYLGRRASVYKTGDKEIADSLMQASFKASGGKSVNITKTYTFSELFMYPATQQFFIFDRVLMDKYLMEDEWPVINWKITDETKKISQLNCQKAIGAWRGRIYEAWFCAELPFHAGPWKLNGLPGLIVEAVDTRQQISFKFAGYRTLNDGKVVIKLPGKNEAKPATVQDFNKMREAIKKNPGIMTSASGGSFTPMAGSSAKIVNSYNNPIELTNH
ncbi:GLPGLI family protein [Mucilaginibacter sp. X5P1]|uniref:GLPGLI family protein n=1 Tax=Mucilaginibacter sp. X5P1 TaxID=2723088 RepID=UPI00161A8C1A|nr:GLPGLI family protein [Mucilaginibacter sp. X5P1]MBB6138287.1 GLPGLI family protein [Mucilaginibacter sp. X5P1]